MLKVPVIQTEQDYEAALKRIRILMEENDPVSDPELEALMVLTENYERKKYPFEEADPVDIIKYRMASLDMNAAALSRRIHMNRSKVSEVLNHKRPLSKEMIRALIPVLGISADILIRKYDLKKEMATLTNHG